MSSIQVIDRLNLLPLAGVRAPLEDFFNPTKNSNFYLRVPARFSQSYITHQDLIQLCKSLSDERTINSTIENIAFQFSLAEDEIKIKALKLFYTYLPDDLKWVIYFTGTGGSVLSSSEFSFFTYFYQETGNRDYIRTNRTFALNHDLTDFIPEHKAALLSFIASNTFRTRMDGLATALPHAFSHSITSDLIPYFPTLVYRYIVNNQIYHPTPELRLTFPIPNYKLTPKDLTRFLSAFPEICIQFKLKSISPISLVQVYDPLSRTPFKRVFPYSTDVLSVLDRTIKGQNEYSPTLYGVELEASGNYSPAHIIDAQEDLFFIMKQDASVIGCKSQNYEFVSVPCSLKAHKRLWGEFFSKIDYSEFDTGLETGNGMHVHIDRKGFKNADHINRLAWFITNPSNFDFIYEISERPDQKNFITWAQVPNYGNRSWVSSGKVSSALCKQIRGAVHFKGSKTIEIRIFKGIVS